MTQDKMMGRKLREGFFCTCCNDKLFFTRLRGKPSKGQKAKMRRMERRIEKQGCYV